WRDKPKNNRGISMNENTTSNAKLKCGLEIHQRLDTKKLFCECYCDANKEISEKHTLIYRKLRAASGELGKVDAAASFEANAGKLYEYNVGEKTSCLVETDDEPPCQVNQEALKATLEIAKALNSKVINEIHVMRKTIVDGSTVSGFQRTALVAINGKIIVESQPISIQTIGLEEESASIIERGESKRTAYGLDRLGIPLIEIATGPDITSPEMAKKVANELGDILRNSGKVQRGLGTIRQDINISIEGGERIEVKGCQDLNAIENIIKNEIVRQQKLIEIKQTLKKRNQKLELKPLDVTKIFQNTNSKMISTNISGGARVTAIKLAGFGGLLGIGIQPAFRFGKELSDYAKLFAGVNGVIHSDEPLDKMGISEEEQKNLRELLNCSSEDAFVICVESEKIGRKALEAVFDRAAQAVNGVPKETRKPEGELTRFMRPLAGSSRMYPETDALTTIIKPIDLANLKEIESPTQKVKRYTQMGLNEQLANRMASNAKFQLFEKIVQTTKCDASTAAVTILETITSLRREGFKIDEVSDEKILTALAEYGEGTIAKPGILVLLKLITQNPDKSIGKIISDNKLQKIEGELLRKLIMENKGDIAEIMKNYKANLDPSQLNQTITHLKTTGKLVQ
ncbi:MAG: Glu-tRNA(Gln) amidotransferase subunit GatE, partial [Candidatus Micrarchaeota archaeon]